MKIQAIQCPNCKNIIYSRARHDYRTCTCETVGIDGGFDYFKISFKGIVPKEINIDVEATRGELYNDWNNNTDKFGLIKKGELES